MKTTLPELNHHILSKNFQHIEQRLDASASKSYCNEKSYEITKYACNNVQYIIKMQKRLQ